MTTTPWSGGSKAKVPSVGGGGGIRIFSGTTEYKRKDPSELF